MASLATTPRTEVLDALASLLDYPGEGFAARARVAGATLAAHAPAAAATVEPFLRAALDAKGAELEERFARTFDWSPTACLEVGWHLYGEQYDRGAFLVRMRGRLRATGVEEGTDLPDHLGSCLRWLGRGDRAEAAAFAREALLPAIAKMRAGIGDGDNPWRPVLAAVEDAVRGLAEDVAPPGGA